MTSYTPVDARSSLCLYVHGDHAYFVDDPHTNSVSAKMESAKPRMHPEVALQGITKNETSLASGASGLARFSQATSTQTTWLGLG